MFDGSDREKLSANYIKIAAECDFGSKISQNVQNLGFSEEDRWVFSKENLNFFRIVQCCRIAVECVRNDIISLYIR